MKNTLLTLSTLLIIQMSGNAQSISQTLYFGPETPSFTDTLTFAPYAGPLTDIQDVVISYVLTINGGKLILDNDAPDPAFFTASYGASLDVTSADATLLDGSFQPIFDQVEALYFETVMLAGNVGDGPFDYDPSSPDGAMLTGTSASDSGSASVNPLFWSAFVSGSGGSAGSGVAFDLSADQRVNTGSVGGIEFAVTPVSTIGAINVTYVIPEPSTALLGTLAAGMFLLRRRR